MKKSIHPQYKDTAFTCVCGAKFEIGSTTTDQSIDICSSCHPFFTGKKKIVDTEGRVERFRKRYEKASTRKPKKK